MQRRPLLNRDKRYVILTGKGTLRRCRDAFRSGVAEFLEKPIGIEPLLCALDPNSSDRMLLASVDSQDPECFPPLPVGTRHVREALRDMERRYFQLDLTIESVASVAGISPEYLCRLFEQHLGRTPLHELHDIRIAEARRRLAETDQPVKAIARDCGYHTTGELDEQFKRRCKCTPTEFRSAERGRHPRG